MIIKNYEKSGYILDSVEDDDVQRLMGSFLSMIIANKNLNIEKDEEVDLLVIMKLSKAFFEKKHVLEAAVTGDWSGIEWALDD